MVCLMYEAQVVQVFVSCFVGMTELAATKAELSSSRLRASVFKGRPRMMRRLCELPYPVVLAKAYTICQGTDCQSGSWLGA